MSAVIPNYIKIFTATSIPALEAEVNNFIDGNGRTGKPINTAINISSITSYDDGGTLNFVIVLFYC